jgi:hypothetical protein
VRPPTSPAAIVVAAVLALAVSGCNPGGSTTSVWSPTPAASTTAGSTTGTPTATTTPPSQPYDYRKLLLQPEDMVQPNSGYSIPQPATLNPHGIPGAESLLVSADGTNAIGFTIVVLGDAAAAPAELPKAVANLVTVRPEQPPAPIAVGDEGFVVVGTTPDGTKSATALMYRYQRALVRVDFYSLPGEPTPTSTVIDIGQKQTAVLRVGLDAAAHA